LPEVDLQVNKFIFLLLKNIAMLKVAGFLKKHDNTFTCSRENYTFSSQSPNLDIPEGNICDYLDSGKTVIAFLHYDYDDEEPIAPAVIYTDGVWMWPAY